MDVYADQAWGPRRLRRVKTFAQLGRRDAVGSGLDHIENGSLKRRHADAVPLDTRGPFARA